MGTDAKRSHRPVFVIVYEPFSGQDTDYESRHTVFCRLDSEFPVYMSRYQSYATSPLILPLASPDLLRVVSRNQIVTNADRYRTG